ncbi:nucleoside/nucleotide kinase family protein [Curvibacter sp. CHRR-16]|uniref:nucleoside/nucleotide kinase family protein n=1 Tax=Curvibacter sp. CHRR-16 TaxID=2835872 RepID=UPI001BD975CB|nr:nucleoside/nucleotide kinase family protein [Curvibacter sp. CHRR-16]MBT0571440.1 nucleoside/nucleotide kinase family protein [Curvibacter sp. CHRR-16]
MPAPHSAALDAGLLQALRLLGNGPRRLLGIVGPPGAGKSTLAELVCATLNTAHAHPLAQLLPMDGFHLAQSELERLGRAQRKGAPDTFDASGYAALLQRLRQQAPSEVVYAPDFRRPLDEPIANALPLWGTTPLVVTEGNYLLLAEDGWAPVAQWLDEVWYLEVDAAIRLEQLAQRHQRFGRTRQEALDWIASTDEPNARRIEATAVRAHRTVLWDAAAGLYRLR